MSFFDFMNENAIILYSVPILVVLAVLVYLVAFFQGREITFWPPKIGKKPVVYKPNPNNSPEQLLYNGYGIEKLGMFTDFLPIFSGLFSDTKEIMLFFIHSRRWRENHLDDIKQFLSERDHKITVFLPNLANKELLKSLEEHFNDGLYLETFIMDAYVFFGKLIESYSKSIDVRLFDLFPTYSFYKYDDTIIMAMYPTSIRRKDVPTFQLAQGGKYWKFISDDIEWMLSNTSVADQNILSDFGSKKEEDTEV